MAKQIDAVDTTPDTKTCPFCAETIKAAAIKCRHCGSMVDQPVSAVVAGKPDPVGPRGERVVLINGDKMYDAFIERTYTIQEQEGEAKDGVNVPVTYSDLRANIGRGGADKWTSISGVQHRDATRLNVKRYRISYFLRPEEVK